MNEIWKEIDGYSDYQVSNLGKVKSYKLKNERILKAGLGKDGYLTVALSNEKNKSKTFTVHQLVAMAFLNHNPCGMKKVINHKDSNRINNSESNLEIITQKQNIRHGLLKRKNNINTGAELDYFGETDSFDGVYWHKRSCKWQSLISVNGKLIFLGYYKIKEEAKKAVLDYNLLK